jgi:hypothetical protein
MDETHLREISVSTGLGFLVLDHPETFRKMILRDDLAELRPAVTDLRVWFGLAAILCLLTASGVERRPQERTRTVRR